VQKFLNTCLPCDEVAFRRALQAIVGDRYWDDWRHFIEDFFGLIMHDGIACTELHMKRACQYRDIRHAWGGGLDSNEIARIGGFRDRDSLYQTITRMRSDYRWFPERKKGPIAQRPFGGMPDWPPLDQAEMEAFRVRRGARTDHPAATPAEEGNLKDGPERISVDGLGLIPMDVLTNTAVFRRLRAHARRFKNELMIIYGERCAISGCSIETLLEAAHIEDHAETGCNELANGILLRVDLHRLFDRGLLAIEPETLVVHLHPSIRSDPDLAGMQGRTMRIDDIEHDSWRPSTDRLRLRWKTFNGLALATDDPIDGRQGSGRGEP
jgi:hypothetical protein